jgi:hypothetical protein
MEDLFSYSLDGEIETSANEDQKYFQTTESIPEAPPFNIEYYCGEWLGTFYILMRFLGSNSAQINSLHNTTPSISALNHLLISLKKKVNWEWKAIKGRLIDEDYLNDVYDLYDIFGKNLHINSNINYILNQQKKYSLICLDLLPENIITACIFGLKILGKNGIMLLRTEITNHTLALLGLLFRVYVFNFSFTVPFFVCLPKKKCDRNVFRKLMLAESGFLLSTDFIDTLNVPTDIPKINSDEVIAEITNIIKTNNNMLL